MNRDDEVVYRILFQGNSAPNFGRVLTLERLFRYDFISGYLLQQLSLFRGFKYTTF